MDNQPNYETLPPIIERLTLQTSQYLADPSSLRRDLECHGALTFTPYSSGLFPACLLPPQLAEATGMGMAWLRDNAHIAYALSNAGQDVLAAPVGRAMLNILHGASNKLSRIQLGTFDPQDYSHRLPVRVNGETLRSDNEKRIQNDAVGYAIWLVSTLIARKVLKAGDEDLRILAQTVDYFGAIKYWQDEDDGHWEEDRHIHASSIGAVMAGIRATQRLFSQCHYEHKLPFDQLYESGNAALMALLDRGITEKSQADTNATQPNKYPPKRRQHDASMLFLVEPLGILSSSVASAVVDDIEKYLVRNVGIARYEGDSYWEPGFHELMTIEERTTFAEGRLNKRNMGAPSIARSHTEAQWTLFDPILSSYWGKKYLATGDLFDRKKQLMYLDRSLAQLTPTNDGRLLLPEAYYYDYTNNSIDETMRLIPNDHIPLLWSQANLLTALLTFEATSPVR